MKLANCPAHFATTPGAVAPPPLPAPVPGATGGERIGEEVACQGPATAAARKSQPHGQWAESCAQAEGIPNGLLGVPHKVVQRPRWGAFLARSARA